MFRRNTVGKRLSLFEIGNENDGAEIAPACRRGFGAR
jgi:hypothetical protein